MRRRSQAIRLVEEVDDGFSEISNATEAFEVKLDFWTFVNASVDSK